MNHTVAYYDTHSKAFVDRTLGRNMSSQYSRFLGYVPKGGKILDAGCGSGRDLKYFADQGYDAQGLDASSAMVEHARNYSGQVVEQLFFDDIAYTAQFDGIWACASLLHVPRKELTSVLHILAKALRPTGVLYMSFKEGELEGEKDDRYFTFWTTDRLRALLDEHPQLTQIESWSVDPHPNSVERWVNVIARLI